MSTYPIGIILSDYENDRMDVEMAMGHSLQHIDKLYEAQATANTNRRKMRSRIDGLENTVNALQKEVARLTALVEKLLSRRKRKSSGKQQESQP